MMKESLLFIPDISGFTNFVQTTEVEHSQHVIAELLEVLLAANTQELTLAEIEGDALFFYKEEEVLSKEKLLAQIETMYTAFYSHLKLLEKNRICPCLACSSAKNLELKIIAHSGQLQFLEVQNNRKPFGESVIQAHRLLKNSVQSDNYVLISDDLAEEINLSERYESNLFYFERLEDTYDGKEIGFLFSEIAIDGLKLKPFQEGRIMVVNGAAKLVFERYFHIQAESLLELITNYKYRHLWAAGADEITYNENEVSRLGTTHMCMVGGKHYDFKVVGRRDKKGNLIYGEETSSPPPVDRLFQFFNVETVSEGKSKLTVELFWEAKSIVKKLFIALAAKKVFRKNVNNSLDRLCDLVNQKLNTLTVL